jgi:hypothetical protein
MSGEASEGAIAKAGPTWLAFACVAGWAIAATSSKPLGIWLAVGGAAAALGVALLVLDHPAAIGLSQPSPGWSSWVPRRLP